MPVFRLISQPFCTVAMVGRWDQPPQRYFLAYRARRDYRWLLGHAVVDEFATFSSPIFFAPKALLGKIYDAGISLGHRRDPEMAIDLGWPPLCVGLNQPAPPLPEDWEEVLLSALSRGAGAPGLDAETQVGTRVIAGYELSGCRVEEAALVGTSAPLLPHQLVRLCEVAGGPLALAFSTGNRIARAETGATQTLRAVSEARLGELTAAVEGLWPASRGHRPSGPRTG